MRHLLDVNVWVALLAAEHVHHETARSFMADPDLRLAVCPTVENGVLRILNTPTFLGASPTNFQGARQAMQYVYSKRDTLWWPDDVTLVGSDTVVWKHVLGHRQIPDCYLLAMAVAHDASFTTLDQRISTRAVRGAEPRHLRVL